MSVVSSGHRHFNYGFFSKILELKKITENFYLTYIVTNQPPYALFFLVSTPSVGPSYVVRGLAFY